MTGVILIIVLLAVSGLVAFVGDKVGRIIGRNRLTFFNLRPRHTAIVITVLSGILITLITMFTLVAISEDVRTTLFGLNRLKLSVAEKTKELTELEEKYQQELQAKKGQRKKLLDELNKAKKEYQNVSLKMKNEIKALEREKNRLTQEISTLGKRVVESRVGVIVVKNNEPVASMVVEGKLSYDQAEERLKKFLSVADANLRKMGLKSKKRLIYLPKEEFNQAVEYLTKKSGQIGVRLISASNVVSGQEVPVHFELFENSLAFKEKEVIISGLIDGKLETRYIEEKLKILLDQTKEKALKKGVVPDPSGSVGEVSYAKIFNISRTIKSANKIVKVEIFSRKNIYSLGPLDIDFTIK